MNSTRSANIKKNLKTYILILDSRTRTQDWEKGPEEDEEGGEGQDQG